MSVTQYPQPARLREVGIFQRQFEIAVAQAKAGVIGLFLLPVCVNRPCFV